MKTAFLSLMLGVFLGFTAGAGEFSAGFARVDITPDPGTPLAGYFRFRRAEGVLDPLEATCVAVSDGEHTALLITLDHLHLSNAHYNKARVAAAQAVNISPQAVYIAATHTHLGPVSSLPVYCKDRPAEEREHLQTLIDTANRRILDGIVKAGGEAVKDLAPAAIRLAATTCPNVSFIRRYRMKDGSVRTNPGANNPHIDHPLGTPDDMVQLVRFRRENRPDIAIVNFQTHPDTIGGNRISADWPGFTRRILERAFDNSARVAVFNGAQGDTNHTCYPANLLPPTKTRYERAQRIGQRLADAVQSVWENARPAGAGTVRYKIVRVRIPAKQVDPAKIEQYRNIHEMHLRGDKAGLEKICGKGVSPTPWVAEAASCLSIHKHRTAFHTMPVSCVTIGRTLAFGGFPGEPFTELGLAVKRASPFAMTIPTCTTNGSFGYLPVESAYAEGGYEQRSSRHAAGVGERLVQSIGAVLTELFPQVPSADCSHAP